MSCNIEMYEDEDITYIPNDSLEDPYEEEAEYKSSKRRIMSNLINAIRTNTIDEYQDCMLAVKYNHEGLMEEKDMFEALTTCLENEHEFDKRPATIDQQCYEGLCASIQEGSIGMIKNGEAYYYGSIEMNDLIKRVVAFHCKTTGAPFPRRKYALKVKPIRGGSLRLRVLRKFYGAILTKPVITTDFVVTINKLQLC